MQHDKNFTCSKSGLNVLTKDVVLLGKMITLSINIDWRAIQILFDKDVNLRTSSALRRIYEK